MAARRVNRSKSVDGRRADDPATLGYLAQAQAMLTTELIKMKDSLDAKNKKIDSLVKQDQANQKLIANMMKDGDEKQAQLACLQNQLHEALNRLGNFLKLRILKLSEAMSYDFFQFTAIVDDRNDEYGDVDPIQFDASVSSSVNGTIDDTFDTVDAEVHHRTDSDEYSEPEEDGDGKQVQLAHLPNQLELAQDPLGNFHKSRIFT